MVLPVVLEFRDSYLPGREPCACVSGNLDYTPAVLSTAMACCIEATSP